MIVSKRPAVARGRQGLLDLRDGEGNRAISVAAARHRTAFIYIYFIDWGKLIEHALLTPRISRKNQKVQLLQRSYIKIY